MMIFGLISLPATIPILLAFFLFFYANGAINSQYIFSTTCLGITIAWGIAAVWGGTSVFVGAGLGGIHQCALASNKVMEAGSVLGQGVYYLTGALSMSSSGGDLEF